MGRSTGALAQLVVAILTVAEYALATNTSTMAYWLNPRAAIIQNTTVIEGGTLFTANYSNGGWGTTTSYGSPYGRLFYMSLCSSFNTSTDAVDALLQVKPESSSSVPFWTGGALFATDYEWYTYGGLPSPRRKPTDINVIQGTLFQQSAAQSVWAPTVDSNYSPDKSANVSNYIALGGWANAPSEKLGFWFSGLQAANGGVIDTLAYPNKSDQANTTARSFIKVDMSSPGEALWQNLTWPDWLQPRAEGGLVWLPYGDQGILLAFGGVDLPGDQASSGLNLNTTAKVVMNDYMTNIAVYDIARDTWALQLTQETMSPPQMAQFCTVTASAADNSSYFVYVYGGYDGTWGHNPAAYDSIWVLSVPAFQWTKITDGTPAHRRSRHACVLPNPTQMLSIGGGTDRANLVNPDWLDVYDLNAQAWTHFYNSSSTDLYKVPSAITTQLGQGSANGGFTIPSGLNGTVTAMLETRYQKQITGYFPYDYCT